MDTLTNGQDGCEKCITFCVCVVVGFLQNATERLRNRSFTSVLIAQLEGMFDTFRRRLHVALLRLTMTVLFDTFATKMYGLSTYRLESQYSLQEGKNARAQRVVITRVAPKNKMQSMEIEL